MNIYTLTTYDPLLDYGLNAVANIKNYTAYTITSDKEYRPDAISYLFYATVDLWWAILAYNGITDVRSLKMGSVIKVPDFSALNYALHSKANTPKTFKTKI